MQTTGMIIASKTTQGKLLKALEEFRKGKHGTAYTPDFEKTDSPRIMPMF